MKFQLLSGEVIERKPLNMRLEDTLSPEALRVLDEENKAPRFVTIDSSLRLKCLDRCGMTCLFCHNERTPVTIRSIGNATTQAATRENSRSSIYAEYNGVNFESGVVNPDDAHFKDAIHKNAQILGYSPNELTDTAIEDAYLKKGIDVKVTNISFEMNR